MFEELQLNNIALVEQLQTISWVQDQDDETLEARLGLVMTIDRHLQVLAA